MPEVTTILSSRWMIANRVDIRLWNLKTSSRSIWSLLVAGPIGVLISPSSRATSFDEVFESVIKVLLVFLTFSSALADYLSDNHGFYYSAFNIRASFFCITDRKVQTEWFPTTPDFTYDGVTKIWFLFLLDAVIIFHFLNFFPVFLGSLAIGPFLRLFSRFFRVVSLLTGNVFSTEVCPDEQLQFDSLLASAWITSGTSFGWLKVFEFTLSRKINCFGPCVISLIWTCKCGNWIGNWVFNDGWLRIWNSGWVIVTE